MTRPEYEAKVKASHERIYKMYLNGMDKKTIARNTDYSETYVDLIIRKAKGPTERRSMSDSDRDRIIKLRKEGKIIKEIASEIGFSMAAVQRCLKVQEEKEKSQKEELRTVIPRNTTYTPIPVGTVLYETIKEGDGTERKMKWIFEKQYPHHALFKNQQGIKRCFTNADLINRGFLQTI